MENLDLTPDPKVLIALTHTPMQPMDALCELIDNAIDSFQMAEAQGQPVSGPLVVVNLPRKGDLEKGIGNVQVMDNGMGLSKESTERALRAGFSGNNSFDSLGLFGMGFNISTGKLGRVTRFLTAKKEDSKALEVIIDLEQIQKNKSFSVPIASVDKPQGFTNGTVVEISKWWQAGNPNNAFVLKLVQYGMPKVRAELGRRYATILRGKNIKIIVNNEPCIAFEHCVWGDHRSVDRRGTGKIPAVFRFNEVVGIQKRCTDCSALVLEGETCAPCGSSSFRTIEERVRGWVGVQRFDDHTEFGVDVIRNGRAIRIGEKAAFFEFTDDLKRIIKDYPIDGPFGRIVGEVHINHVPVDFLKQDFQRSSSEWQRAMSYIRGESSLQPTQPNADKNTSPIYKLYQGYRRVRTAGKADMYMGYWDQSKNGPQRISREIEADYYEKFKKKTAGYYDDTEWWKQVEAADTKPLPQLIECPECHAQNPQGQEMCLACAHILNGKDCVVCKKNIPASAVSCPHCGKSQIIEVKEAWICRVCGEKNIADADQCHSCGAIRGAVHPFSTDYLLSKSNKSDELSIQACTVKLADGSNSSPIDVEVYKTREQMLVPSGKMSIPVIVDRDTEKLRIFIDPTHYLFDGFRVLPEHQVAMDAAQYIWDRNSHLAGDRFKGVHGVPSIMLQIMKNNWEDRLVDSTEDVKEEIGKFFDSLRNAMPMLIGPSAKDYYDDMDDSQKTELIKTLMAHGQDIGRLPALVESGDYLRYIDEVTVIDIFKKHPESFFDGKFWETCFDNSSMPGMAVEAIHALTKARYLNCLEDIAVFSSMKSHDDKNLVHRARASLSFLDQKTVH